MTDPTSFDTPTIIALGLAALAGVETLLRGASAILGVIAPRTKTTVDDRMKARVDDIHDKLDALLKLAPRPPGAVPVVVVRNPEAGFILSRLMIILASSGAGIAVGFAILLGCGSTSKTVGKAALSDAVDCTTADRVKLEAQFGPTVELALQRATGGDGKIDLPSLNEIGRSLEADGWCVLETEAAKLIAWLSTKVGTSSAAAPLDAQDFAAKLAGLRSAKFGATQFKIAPAAPAAP